MMSLYNCFCAVNRLCLLLFTKTIFFKTTGIFILYSCHKFSWSRSRWSLLTDRAGGSRSWGADTWLAILVMRAFASGEAVVDVRWYNMSCLTVKKSDLQVERISIRKHLFRLSRMSDSPISLVTAAASRKFYWRQWRSTWLTFSPSSDTNQVLIDCIDCRFAVWPW